MFIIYIDEYTESFKTGPGDLKKLFKNIIHIKLPDLSVNKFTFMFSQMMRDLIYYYNAT